MQVNGVCSGAQVKAKCKQSSLRCGAWRDRESMGQRVSAWLTLGLSLVRSACRIQCDTAPKLTQLTDLDSFV